MEDMRLERAPFFPFPIIPLFLLLEIACWIGRQEKPPIWCLFSGVEISLHVVIRRLVDLYDEYLLA
jgi:hypothetical protein